LFHNSCASHKLAIEKLFVVRRDTSSKQDKTRQSDLFVRAPLLSNADWLSTFFLQTPLNVSRFCLSECRILSNWRRCRVSWRVWGTPCTSVVLVQWVAESKIVVFS
jgi:hypothetical protein